jgi:glucans biosynthesis protein C
MALFNVTMAHALKTKPSERLFFLDWLRIIAFAALVLYHVGMYYVTWDFHVKSPFASRSLEPWMKLTEPWRMSLIFMISGAATALMLKHGPGISLARNRSLFLLLPLFCGILFVVPPQSYFEVVQKFNYQGSYLDFLTLYFKSYKSFCAPANSSQCLIMPTWNHLWFLPYLWVYTMILILVGKVWPNGLAISVKKLDQHVNAGALLIAPILLICAIRLTLQPRFTVTHALIGDWYSHAIYACMFAVGAIFASSKLTWEKLAVLRWVALAIAIACWGLFAFVSIGKPLGYLVVSTFHWCAICAAFGFSKQHLNRDSRFRALLNEAVFPIYVLHQTIIIIASQWLLPIRLTPAIEGPLLVAATFAVSFALYVLIKEFSLLRPWFGLKRNLSNVT